MNPTAIIAILVFIGLSTSIMFLIFWALLRGSKGQMADMEQLMSAVQNLTHQPLSAEYICKSVYTHNQIEITLAITPKSKHTDFSFSAYILEVVRKNTEPIPVDCILPIRFRLEHWKDRVGKTLRLNREFQTQDQAFDDKVYIESDCSDDILHHLLSHPNIRHGILALLEGGYSEVVFFNRLGHDITVEVKPPNLQLLDPTTFAHAATNIERLAYDTPHFAPFSIREPRSGLMGSIAFSIVVLGLALYFLLVKSWEILDYSLWPWTIPVLIGLIIFNMLWSWMRFRNRSTGLRAFAGWMAWSTMILTFAAYPITAIINTTLSTTTHPTTATVTYRTYSKGTGRNKTPSCNLHLRFARTDLHLRMKDPNKNYVISIPCKTYKNYQKGQTIKLHLHKGLFNTPWVDNLQPPKK